MTTDEDVLLKEVEEDLKYENQLQFLKNYGPWLAGAAGLLVVGVGTFQFMGGVKTANQEAMAEAFFRAVVEPTDIPSEAADALDQVAAQLDGGYKGLAELREASLWLAASKPESALLSFRAVYENTALPERMRDLARLRAAHVILDSDAPGASALVKSVVTEAFRPYAQEVEAIAALATGDYETGYALLSSLASDPAVSAQLASRAAILAPVADAGRRGVTLEPETSVAEDFIESFTDQLSVDGVLQNPQPTTPPVNSSELP